MSGRAIRAMSVRATRAIEACLGGLGGLALLAMMAVTVIDVVGRSLLDRPLPGGFELTEILLALMIFLGLPLVSMRGGHVTITLIDAWFAPGAARLRDGAIALVCATICGGIAWRLWVLGERLLSYGDVFDFLPLSKAVIAFPMRILAAVAALLLVVRAFKSQAVPRP